MSNPTAEQRCRHYGTWIISGGTAEWCYHCGAYRSLERLHGNTSTPLTQWVRPTGIGGENPWPMKMLKRQELKRQLPNAALQAYHGDIDGDFGAF